MPTGPSEVFLAGGTPPQCLVWDVTDLRELRDEHRLVATPVTNVSIENKAPRNMLPAVLMPEQLTLGLSHGFIKLRLCGDMRSTGVKLNVNNSQESRNAEELLHAYRGSLLVNPKATSIDVIESRPCKIARTSSSTISASSCEAAAPLTSGLIAPNSHVVIETKHTQQTAQQPDASEGTLWNYPQSSEEKRCCVVFADLWEQGLFVTCGSKFGGNFLVYVADPRTCHAHAVVKVLPADAMLRPVELASFGRMCTMVKKTPLLALVHEVQRDSSPAHSGGVDSKDSCAVQYISYEFKRADEL
jgi:tRNA-splicing endonuclease subunit Sen34